MNPTSSIESIAKGAKNASYKLASLSEDVKNNALECVAEAILKNKPKIFAANKKDLEAAYGQVQLKRMSKSVFNRLVFNEEKINAVVDGIYDVIELDDPVNKKQWGIELDKGLELYRISCPIGVVGVIFESRPDVIPQIVSLAIKSANAVILKGGSEAMNTNIAIFQIIKDALDENDMMPFGAINLIKTREDVSQMLNLNKYIDLLIPRGSNSLVQYVQNNTKIPVLGHSDGICHIYVEENIDFKEAIRVCVDSKIQYPAACNAVETILINSNIADTFLPELAIALKNEDVLIKGCELCQEIVTDINPASEIDWKTEYGDKIVSIKIVDNIIDAVEHINYYGSGHTDCILTKDKHKATIFMDLIDSAGVFLNTSTRFADGYRYGLGAEVGISTNKTHARGPVGLEGLTIYKYKMYGKGHIVDDYTGEKSKGFTHKRLI